MEIKSLYPIIVSENLEETKKFYCEVFNFKIKHTVERKDGGHVLVLSNDAGIEIEIMEKPKDGPIKTEAGLYGFRMNVNNLEEAADALSEKGYTISSPILQTAMSRNLFIKDNNGINITLMEHIKK